MISVTKNNEEGLARTLKSTFYSGINEYNVDLVIMNGGSAFSSNSVKACLELIRKDQIRIFNKGDSGIFHAMNDAISYVKTEYVLFMNSGDVFTSQFSFKYLLEILIRNNSQWLIADAVSMEPKGGLWKHTKPLGYKHKLGINSFPHQATIYRTELLRNNGLFVLDSPIADWEASIKLSLQEPPRRIHILMSSNEPWGTSQSITSWQWALNISKGRARNGINIFKKERSETILIYTLKLLSVVKSRATGILKDK